MADSSGDEFSAQGCAAIIGAIAALIGAVAGFKACNPDPERPAEITPGPNQISAFCQKVNDIIESSNEVYFYEGNSQEEATEKYNELVLNVDECIPEWTRRLEENASDDLHAYYYTEFSNGHRILVVNWSYFKSTGNFEVTIDMDTE